MSSVIKLDICIPGDNREPDIDFLDGTGTSVERANVMYRTEDNLHTHGNMSISNTGTSAERRGVTDRFLKTNRAALNENVGLPVGGNDKRQHGSGKKTGPLVSGTAYCISSCSMILLNKVVLSAYNFNAGISLMFYQNLIASVIVILLGLSGAISVEKPNWKLMRVWIPVNLIFVGMLVSGMYSLKHINVAMVTILKNVTNILTAIGELYLFRKCQNQKVWMAMLMMIISAVTSGVTDLSFDAVGYGWQMTNCILTASYSVYSFLLPSALTTFVIDIITLKRGEPDKGLQHIFRFLQWLTSFFCVYFVKLTLRRVMDKAKQLTRSGSLNEFSMVLLNNLLSLPFAMLLILLFGEWRYVITTDVVQLPMFWVVATASGFLGLAISFTSMWFLHQTGPTTYSLVGSLNKIPVSIAGLVLFKVPLSVTNLFSILFGLFAGVFFARAKMS